MPDLTLDGTLERVGLALTALERCPQTPEMQTVARILADVFGVALGDAPKYWPSHLSRACSRCGRPAEITSRLLWIPCLRCSCGEKRELVRVTTL